MRPFQHRGYVWQTWALLLSKCLAQNGLPAREDIMRMSGGKLAVIGNYAYYDGGSLSHVDLSTDEQPAFVLNDTIAIDLTKKFTAEDVNLILTPKRDGQTTMDQQAMLKDESEEVFYIWGGATGEDLPGPSLWQFSPDNQGSGSWSSQTSKDPQLFGQLHRSAVSAIVSTPKAGFIFGGWSTATTDSDPAGNIRGFLSFDFKTKAWEEHNDGTPYSADGTIWGGTAVYAPNFGPNGLVFVLGGVTRRFETGQGYIGYRNIHFFDPVNMKWYTQRTTGDVPRGRHQACSVGVAGADGTFDIFMWGGANDDYSTQLGELWVLSLPAFTWTKVYDDLANERAEHDCAVVGKSQMLSMGGMSAWGTSGYPRWSIQDQLPYSIGIFDMNALEWKEEFDPDADEYSAHEDIAKWYKEGNLKTMDWTNDDVKALFVEIEDDDNSDGGNNTPTDNSNDNSTKDDTKSDDSGGTPVGAIAGGVVGGVAALAAIGAGWWFFARRRRNNQPPDEGNMDGPAEQIPQQYHSKIYQGPYAPVPQGSPGPEGYYMNELPGKIMAPPVEMAAGPPAGHHAGHFAEMDANQYQHGAGGYQYPQQDGNSYHQGHRQ